MCGLTEELLLEVPSKWPDRFSLKVAVRAKPESAREVVDEAGENIGEVGEPLGDGGEFVFVVEPVEGRSYSRLWSFLDCKKALNTGGRGAKPDPSSPNIVEFKLTYLAKVLGGALWVYNEEFSEENVSHGNASIA
jgi:hypothetical protein